MSSSDSPHNNTDLQAEFEESVLGSAFTHSEPSIKDEYDEYMVEEDDIFNDTISEEGGDDFDDDIDYHPGDLVNLRGLFDEDAVDPLKNSTTLDFDEIPDDIDIDEPIEIEELSKTGKILNVVVQASLIILGLIVFGFVINAGLVVGAVLSSNFQSRIFIDVSDLDKDTANINATIMTESTNFGSFIEGELDPVEPVKAFLYLSNEEKARHEDVFCEIEYKPPSDKDKIIKFNGGVKNVIHLQNIKMKLNPKFDASRLSGFMEPKDGHKFHERYPRNIIVYYSLNLRINSFWIPIPYPIRMFSKLPMDQLDEDLETKKQEKMKEFDFNPKFVDISRPKPEKMLLKVRQPVPKFFAPPNYQVAIHMPEMDIVVKQFTNKEPKKSPDIKKLFNLESSKLVTAKVKPFRMIMGDSDMTPNIVELEAVVDKDCIGGFVNVLEAIRDDKLGTLAFLFASKDFDPEKQPKPVITEDNADVNVLKSFNGCTLPVFMKTFWGRQPYPVAESSDKNKKDAKKQEVPALPSLPEYYNPAKDSAIKIDFDGLEKDKNFLKFRITANTHYIISEYKLPLLMLTGEIPPMNFKMLVNLAKKSPEVAKFIIKHVNTNEVDANGNRALGKHLTFDVFVEIIDMKLLSHFAMKYSRMSQIIPKKKEDKTPSAQDQVGKMFKAVAGAEIVADYDIRDATWVSKIASVFNVKINLSGEKMVMLYLKNNMPIVPEGASKQVKSLLVYSEEAEDLVEKSLVDLLGFEFQPDPKDSEKVQAEKFEKMIFEMVEELKKKVDEVEAGFLKESLIKSDFAAEAKTICDETLDKSKETVVAKTVSEIVNESDATERLAYHKKLIKVRELLVSRIALWQASPITKEIVKTALYTKVASSETEMTVNTAIGLSENDKAFDNHMIFTWNQFDVAVSDAEKVQLAKITFEPASFKFSLSDSTISVTVNDDGKIVPIKLITAFGPENPKTMEVKEWMKYFRKFVDGLMDKKTYFLPFNFSVISPTFSVSWPSELPTAAIPAMSTSVEKEPAPVEPGFFDNLTKSHFDFIGYGFYRLIFHAILPNPEECPLGSSVLNVEIDLPPTTTFLFANADSGDLKENTCFASVNTARPLKIWTQIVDGVLCNMYAVAEGLEEQEMAIHARVESERSNEIINSFSSLFSLRNSFPDAASEKKDKKVKTESPLEKYRTPSVISLAKVANEKRFALITAVPVSVEILNFEHLIKIVDEFGEKRRVQIGSGDPTQSVLNAREMPSLFNVITSALAGNFPLDFNTPEQLKKASTEGPRRIQVKSDKVILNVVTSTPSPDELIVKTSITMPSRLVEPKSESELSKVPYVTYETLAPENRFLHPVIRWGKTELTFAFSEFKLTLNLSAGDIKVTNDGSKILFDALNNFKIDFSIKAQAGRKKSFKQSKEIFKTSSIRQVFKRCQDFVRRSVEYSYDPENSIDTTSIVSYGLNDNQNFHFLGLADMESFFLLQGVIIRRMFAGSKQPDDEFDDPTDDPTYIDFGMLISLGHGKPDAEYSKLPKLSIPCFFTNFCSAEQLGYSRLNRRGLLNNGEYVPVTLHIGETFQPLAASIAAGFSTFLPLFYMENYPKTLEWHLSIPKDQVIGMEMNGQGMFYGKSEAIYISKSAEIPYPNALVIPSNKKAKKTKKSDDDSVLKGPDKYDDRGDFDDKFFRIGKHKFKDEVLIKVQAQIPDSLPDLLRKMNWPLFFLPMNTITLHPPLINVQKTQATELSHAPISVAMSDSMEYKTNRGDIIKASLLTKLFAAFIEESSSSGMEIHKKSLEPSTFRFYQTNNLVTSDLVSFGSGHFVDKRFNFSDKEVIHVVIWLQFPWALGSIGFDFGSNLMGKVYLQDEKNSPLLEGFMSQHYMIGKIARMRLDLTVPVANIGTIIQIVTPIVTKLGLDSSERWTKIIALAGRRVLGVRDITDIPVGAEFNIDNNFIAETELVVPKRLFKEPELPVARSIGTVNLTHVKKNIDNLISKYEKYAPQAIACVYNRKVSEAEKTKQIHLWTQLDLTMTRVYYPEVPGINPGCEFDLFLQLRTIHQVPVCGLLDSVGGLAVMIEYIRPSRPFEILFEKGVTHANPDRIYLEASRDEFTSVFCIKAKLNYTGRYKIFAATIPLSKKAANLKTLRYKEIRFTEIYVKNSR